MTDLLLTSGHHLAAFALFGALFAQFAALRPRLSAAAVERIAKFDIVYGASAGLVLAFGIARVAFAAKGWEYYSANAAFWLKLGAFLLIGLLSVPPTLMFRRWRSRSGGPSDHDVRVARRYVQAQLALFVLIPIASAAMARGYGQS